MNGAQYAYDFFRQRGYNDAAAAGIVGNLGVESSFNPMARGDKGTAFGIGQWRGDRAQNLFNYARENGQDWRSLDTQLAFYDHEGRNGLDAGAGRAFKALQDPNISPADAAHAVMTHFERPNADPRINAIARRQKIANEVFGGSGGDLSAYDTPASVSDPASQRAPSGAPMVGGGSPITGGGGSPMAGGAGSPMSPALASLLIRQGFSGNGGGGMNPLALLSLLNPVTAAQAGEMTPAATPFNPDEGNMTYRPPASVAPRTNPARDVYTSVSKAVTPVLQTNGAQPSTQQQRADADRAALVARQKAAQQVAAQQAAAQQARASFSGARADGSASGPVQARPRLDVPSLAPAPNMAYDRPADDKPIFDGYVPVSAPPAAPAGPLLPTPAGMGMPDISGPRNPPPARPAPAPGTFSHAATAADTDLDTLHLPVQAKPHLDIPALAPAPDMSYGPAPVVPGNSGPHGVVGPAAPMVPGNSGPRQEAYAPKPLVPGNSGPHNEAFPVPTPRPDQMPTGSNVPVPTPRPKSGAFNMGKFTNVLGALGSIMAGLDTGSPEVKPVGLSGFSHKPDGNIQIALPKGLL